MVVSCDGLEGTVSGPMLQVLGTETSQHTQVIMLQYRESLAGKGEKASGSRVTFRRNAKTGNLWAADLPAFEGCYGALEWLR